MTLKIYPEDRDTLDRVLTEAGIDDTVSVQDTGAYVVAQFACYEDQLLVMDDLDFRSIPYTLE